MASLAGILAGSAIGNAGGQFGRQMMQGAMDRQAFDSRTAQNDQQQKEWDFRNSEIARGQKAQGIEDTVTSGASDFDRLNELAGIAEKAGRGDLARKYQSLATQAKEVNQRKSIAMASMATINGSPNAINLWNNSGLYDGSTLVGIQPKKQEDGTPDPSGSFIFSVKDPNTGTVHPLEVPRGMMALGAANPEEIPKILERAQNSASNMALKDRGLDIQEKRADETERHNRAMEAARRLVGSKAAPGKLTNEQWRMNWAKTPAEQGGGGMTPQAAMEWAMDPRKNDRNYWQQMKLVSGVAKANYYDTTDTSKALEILGEMVRRSPIGNPQQPVSTPQSPNSNARKDGAKWIPKSVLETGGPGAKAMAGKLPPGMTGGWFLNGQLQSY
jgi:hypothetical protein